MIGCPHPDYLPLSAHQFIDWLNYWRVEPFGDEWRQTAMVAWVQSLQLGMKRKLTIDDFMPCKETPKKQEVAAKLHGFFKALAAYGKGHDR